MAFVFYVQAQFTILLTPSKTHNTIKTNDGIGRFIHLFDAEFNVLSHPNLKSKNTLKNRRE